jgi:hypothetical protein
MAGLAGIARPVFAVLAALFTIGIVVQYLLAGVGILGGGSMEAHEVFGYAVLHFFPVLMLIAALLARLPKGLVIMAGVLMLVTLVQPIWVTAFRDEFLGAFHFLGALVIFALSRDLAERGMRAWRTRPSESRV